MNVSKDFVTAGKAIFTISHNGKHFTFRVAKKAPTTRFPRPAYFVSWQGGEGVGRGRFVYIGMLDIETGLIKLTKNSQVKPGDLPLVVAQWVLSVLWSGKAFPPGALLQHVGKCGRCGLKLTDPVSIACGIGPDCREIMGIKVDRKVAA